MKESLFLFFKKFLFSLKTNYSYQHLLSHGVCIVLGIFVYEILTVSDQKQGFPINSIVLTLDKNKFKKDILVRKEDSLFITKASAGSPYFCKVHSHPIKVINICSNSYSFRLKKDDIISIKKQILDSKSSYILNLQNKDEVKPCYVATNRVKYEN